MVSFYLGSALLSLLVPTMHRLLSICMALVILTNLVDHISAHVLGAGSAIFGSNQTTHTAWIEDEFGQRNVSFFVNQNAKAVVEGDIIYGPIDELLDNVITNTRIAAPSGVKARALTDTTRRWPGANIHYRFDSDATEALRGQRVRDAITSWLAIAPYLTFTQERNGATSMNGVVTITANEGTCYSDVGYRDKPLNMNLDSSCGVAYAIHEIGHAIGEQ